MDSMFLKARAKINITLDVIGKRPDGYHDLKMIMQSLLLCDGVYMKKINKSGIRLKADLTFLPVDERNLAWKAAKLLQDEFQIEDGIFIELRKKIPVAAGLAGGSSDCAAVLVGMNRLFELGLSMKELKKYGLTLGSDVPFCLQRGTALAEGVGEILTPLPSCPKCFIVLAKPPISVSTASVFKNLKLEKVTEHPDTEKAIEAIQKKDIHTMSENLCNVLESVVIPLYPIVGELKRTLLAQGALGALMSGSGPTVFGIFDNRELARAAYTQIREKLHIRDVFITSAFHNH